MTTPTRICVAGYAVTQALIVSCMDAGALERVIGLLAVTPIALYCAWLDEKERQQ